MADLFALGETIPAGWASLTSAAPGRTGAGGAGNGAGLGSARSGDGGEVVAAPLEAGAISESSAQTAAFNAAPVVTIVPPARYVRQGGEFVLGSGQTLFEPTIAALSAGRFIATWTNAVQGSDGGFSYSLVAQVYDATGARIGGEIAVGPAGTASKLWPAVTELASGGLVVIWGESDASEAGIKAQIFDAAGGKVGAEFLVNTVTFERQIEPEITGLSSGGFVVTWTDYSGQGGDTSDSAVKAQLFDATGGKVGAEILVNTVTLGYQDEPAIATLASGRFVVSWADNSSKGIKAQIFDATGARTGGEFFVNTTTQSYHSNPEITALASGGFVATWQEFRSGNYVKAQVFDAAGAKVGVEFIVEADWPSNYNVYPTVAVLSSGAFVISWTILGGTADTSGHGVLAQVYDASGARVGSEFLVNTVTLYDQYRPVVVGLTSGDFVISWYDSSGEVAGVLGEAFKAQIFRPSSTYAATEQVAISLKGSVAVADSDAGTDILTATLSVGYGVLNVGVGTSGATIVGGNGTARVVLSGTLAQLDALLRTDATSAITYIPDTDSPPASTTFTVSVNDGGATGAAAATIEIAAVNDAPSGTNARVTLLEDGNRAFEAADFGFTDVDGNVLAGIVVTTPPAAGVLTLNGVAVTAGRFVTAAQLAGGQLVFAPAPDTNGAGYASFAFQVRDDGGTAGGGQDTDPTPNTITIDVTPVNDAPVVTFGPYAESGEFRVNTVSTSGGQTQSTITGLTSGGFVVSWTDTSSQGGDASGSGVKAQLFDAAGGKVGAEFLVNTATLNAQSQPIVAGLTSGGFVVSWTDLSSQGGDANGRSVKGQIFDVAGVRVGGEFLVNTVTQSDQMAPAVTGLASGGFVVSWTDFSRLGGDTSNSAVKAQIFDSTGAKVGAELLVNTATLNIQSEPNVTALASGGFVVSWNDSSGQGGDTDGSGIKAQIFDATGAKLGTEFRVNTVTSLNQADSAVTALASGGFVVSWTDSSGQGGDVSATGIKAQVFDATGARVGGEFLVNTSTLNAQTQPAIIALSSGGFTVVWTDASGQGGDTSGPGIKAQLLSATGTKVGAEFLVNAITYATQNQPAIAALASGGLAISWSDVSAGIKAKILQPLALAYIATEQVAISLKGGVTIADVDAGSAILTATLSVSYGVLNVGGGTSGAAVVSGNGTASVVIRGTLAQLDALLRTDATSVVTYTAHTDAPPADTTFTVSVDDGGATGSGGTQTAVANTKITIVAVDDPPAAVADTPTTAENLLVTGNLLTNDIDPDGGPMAVMSVNAVTASVGHQMTLPSGALLTVNADGTYSYDPNGRFDWLISAATAAARGASNAQATDSFSYALNGGSPATVTVTITGVDGPGDQLHGSAGNDVITGTDAGTRFDLSQGGSDTATGGAGDDRFYVGAALDALDRIDGGGGAFDQLGIQGNYTAQLLLQADTFRNVELVVFLPGSDTRFGAPGTGVYNYNIRTHDGNVALGQKLAVQANMLGADESLTFDGSAELDGGFLFYGGLGADVLTGGQKDDGFYFGTGRWGPNDRVDGQGGTLDQLGLQGDYNGATAIAFGANQIIAIDAIVLLSGADTRFGGGGSRFSYTLKMHDDNAVGATPLAIQATALRFDEVLIFDASAETGTPYRIFGGAAGDTITGGAGNDEIWGRGGPDILCGGAGNDVFGYLAGDSTPGARDRVLDFAHGDLIDVSRIGFHSFVGGGPLTGAGQLRASHDGMGWIIDGDIDGNGTIDLSIRVDGDAGFSWTLADFRLASPPPAMDVPGSFL